MDDHADDDVERADAAEVAAYRKAVGAFFRALGHQLTNAQVRALAGTNHEHHTMLMLECSGECCVVRVRMDYGEVLRQADVAELIEAARVLPGGVTRG